MQELKKLRTITSNPQNGWTGGYSNRSGHVSETKEIVMSGSDMSSMKRMFTELKEKTVIRYEDIDTFLEKVKQYIDPEVFGEEVIKDVYSKLNELFVAVERKIVYRKEELERLINQEVSIDKVRSDVSAYKYVRKHPLFVLYQGKEEWDSEEIKDTLLSLQSFGGVSREEVQKMVEELIDSKVSFLTNILEERLRKEERQEVEEEDRSMQMFVLENRIQAAEDGVKEVETRFWGMLSDLEERLKRMIEEVRELAEVEKGSSYSEGSYDYEEAIEMLKNFKQEIREELERIFEQVYRIEAEVREIRQARVEERERREDSGFSLEREATGEREEEDTERENLARVYGETQEKEGEDGKQARSKKDNTAYLVYIAIAMVILALIAYLLKG